MMLEYEKIIDKIAKTLYDMFNGGAHGLTIDHFKMEAANGLFPAMELSASFNPNFANLYSQFTQNYGPQNVILNNLDLKLNGCD